MNDTAHPQACCLKLDKNVGNPTKRWTGASVGMDERGNSQRSANRHATCVDHGGQLRFGHGARRQTDQFFNFNAFRLTAVFVNTRG